MLLRTTVDEDQLTHYRTSPLLSVSRRSATPATIEQRPQRLADARANAVQLRMQSHAGSIDEVPSLSEHWNKRHDVSLAIDGLATQFTCQHGNVEQPATQVAAKI